MREPQEEVKLEKLRGTLRKGFQGRESSPTPFPPVPLPPRTAPIPAKPDSAFVRRTGAVALTRARAVGLVALGSARRLAQLCHLILVAIRPRLHGHYGEVGGHGTSVTARLRPHHASQPRSAPPAPADAPRDLGAEAGSTRPAHGPPPALSSPRPSSHVTPPAVPKARRKVCAGRGGTPSADVRTPACARTTRAPSSSRITL